MIYNVALRQIVSNKGSDLTTLNNLMYSTADVKRAPEDQEKSRIHLKRHRNLRSLREIEEENCSVGMQMT